MVRSNLQQIKIFNGKHSDLDGLKTGIICKEFKKNQYF